MKHIFVAGIIFLIGFAYSIDTIPGTALQFDGVNEYVNIGRNSTLNVDNTLTIEAWVKPTDLSGRYGIFSTRNSGDSGGWQLEVGIGSGGTGRVAVTGVSTWVAQTGDNVIKEGEWVHIAYTRSGIGSTHKIYVNGEEQTLVSESSYKFYDNYSDKVIASGTSGTQLFPGQIEEVRLWEIVRTADEIRESINLPLTGSEFGLVSYWQFNNGTGIVLTDSVGSNDGELVNLEEEDWIDSLIPFGQGSVNTQIISSTGFVDFTGTGFSMDVTEKAGVDTVVVTKLDMAPNVNPQIETTFDSQYWIVRKYGAGTFISNINFSIVEDLTIQDENTPEIIYLFGRNTTADGNWSFMDYANSVNHNNDQSAFDGIINGGQFIIARKVTPVITNLSPIDDASDILVDDNLEISFDRTIFAGTGNIELRKSEDNSIVETIPAFNTIIADGVVQINLTNNLEFNTDYYVLIDSLAFTDGNENYFEGIFNEEEWNFVTEEFLITSLFPSDDTTNVLLDENLEIVFDRNIIAGEGNIEIRNTSDDSIFEIIAASSCDIVDSIVTIDSSLNFDFSASYYILIDSTAFMSMDSVCFEGISDKTVWNFAVEEFLITSVFPSDDAIEVNPNDSLIEIVFNRKIIYGSGNLTVYNYADDSIFITIPADSAVYSDSLVTITSYNNYEYGKKYYVLIDSNAFLSEDSVKFAGIKDKNTWDFTTAAVSFNSISTGFAQESTKSTAIGDIDNDNDLDVVIIYRESVIIYYNDNCVFTPFTTEISGSYANSIDLGDYDNDGDLDILVTGAIETLSYIANIYRNDSGSFTNIQAGLTGLRDGCGRWGDYDNDGDLDIFTMGWVTSGGKDGGSTKVYRNDSGVFTDIGIPSYSNGSGSADWGDYDNDGDLDILYSGGLTTGGTRTTIMRNDGGTFVRISTSMGGSYTNSVHWGDYDNDGDLDALISSTVYRNDNGTFTEIHAGMTEAQLSFSDWGDYDNDGDLDIIFTGYIEYGVYYTKLYENNEGVFAEKSYGFTNMYGGTVKWADFDNDGDLDLFMSGTGYASAHYVRIYRNNLSIYNNSPSVPSSLNAVLVSDTLSFSYGGSADIETTQDGLSYNIDVRTFDQILVSGNSDINTGCRYLPSSGNAGQTGNYNLIFGDIFTLPQEMTMINWRVQAVDHCFKGSEYVDQEIYIDISDDLVLKNESEMYSDDILSWELLFTDSLTSYELQIADDVNFSSALTDTIQLNKSIDKSFHGISLNELTDFDSLQNNTRYYWRVRPNYIYRTSRYPAEPSTFIYNPTYSTPSPIKVNVEGNLVTLTWNDVKDAEKGEVYNVYSSDEPYAVFPDEWNYEATVNGTQWLTTASELKKFYCVTAMGSSKEVIEKEVEENESGLK